MPGVCVVGAGVVGLSSAWYLAEAGWRVTLLEQAAVVGSGASYRNGGQLSYRYVSPLADRGVPLKALKWLMQADGPLRFRPRADPAQWLWLARFLSHCHGRANRQTTERLARLGAYSKDCLTRLMHEHQVPPFDWREAGKLVVYRSPAGFERAARGIGAAQQVLGADECVAREGALAALQSRLAGGIYTSDEAVADCHRFCLALDSMLAAHPNFAGRITATAQRFEATAAQRLRLHTSDGVIDSEQFVLAAGNASAALAATLGVRLPIYPLKGYSLSAPIAAHHQAPAISVTDFECKTLYARIGDQLRIAAMVDLVGYDTRIAPGRIAGLLRRARNDMPLAADYQQAEPWAGLRPATPDGAPIIGPSPVPGLWLNTGHGPLGFTFACGSASLLAHVMSEGSSPIPMDGLTWQDR